MKNKICFYLILFLYTILVSCYKTVIIPATKDASLSCLLPDINIDGKKEAFKGKGFGIKKKFNNKYITYPIMYLSSNDDYDFKEAFVIGGFDLSKIKGKIKHASLKFYINYSSKSLKRVAIFVRPLKNDWDEKKITYLDIYKDDNPDTRLTAFAESDDKKCILIVFDIKSNLEEISNKIPYSGSYKTISINVTKFVDEWSKNPDLNHGFLIDPLWMNDPRYCTTDLNNIISDYGIIEIATTEWLKWDGKVPVNFYLEDGRWLNINNQAKKRVKYIPRLEIILTE